jgi:hypothetical protein
VLPAASLVGVALAGCEWRITLALLAANGIFSGAGYGGYQMNHISLSPTFAGKWLHFLGKLISLLWRINKLPKKIFLNLWMVT